MIDQYQIQKLQALPIEQVAEELGLRVSRHKAICPFHDDTRPSLTCDVRRNRYRCYVCDAHGGVIDLVMNVLGRDFVEACRWLGAETREVRTGAGLRTDAGVRTNANDYPLRVFPPSHLGNSSKLDCTRFGVGSRLFKPQPQGWGFTYYTFLATILQ